MMSMAPHVRELTALFVYIYIYVLACLVCLLEAVFLVDAVPDPPHLRSPVAGEALWVQQQVDVLGVWWLLIWEAEKLQSDNSCCLCFFCFFLKNKSVSLRDDRTISTIHHTELLGLVVMLGPVEQSLSGLVAGEWEHRKQCVGSVFPLWDSAYLVFLLKAKYLIQTNVKSTRLLVFASWTGIVSPQWDIHSSEMLRLLTLSQLLVCVCWILNTHRVNLL